MLVAFALVLALGTAVVSAAVLRFGESEEAKIEPEFPTALGEHIEKLIEAVPGNGGEPEEGPGASADFEFQMKAYPASNIPLAVIQAERAAWTAVKGRALTGGKGKPGTWVSVGPSDALYPATPLRNTFNYVPAAYLAGGRTTILAIAPTCKPGNCRLWAAAAGGGIWRTKNALNGQPSWQFLSGSFGIQAVSSITVDPNDASGNTLWVGTGESNSSGDSAAGVGVYKSTDGGDTWTGPLGADAFNGRAVGTIAVKPGDPNTIYAGSTRGVRGVSSVSGGAASLIPGAPQWGLYKSTNGGASWTFIHNGAALTASCGGDADATNGTPCSPRGVRRVAIDPSDPNTVYAGSYARGVWRSTDGGTTWTQIKPSLNSGQTTTRPELAVTKLPNGKTRMYLYEGNVGAPYSRLFRSDDVATGAPVFQDLTSSSTANPGYGTYNLCTGQCWYDVFVHTPAGHPDMVYVGGSYSYGQQFTNKRGVVLSTDAGVSATDMTMDATSLLNPNGLHPDQHFLVTNPSNPLQFFEANDGGIMRSSGKLVDASSACEQRQQYVGAFSASQLARCQQMLSAVPSELQSMNKGLPTLQFQSISVSPFNSNVLQGGTQDNGTWETSGNPNKWLNTMIGDGGQSGFDAKLKDFRFHTYFDASPEVNFNGGNTADWIWISDPIFGIGNLFYVAIISDPVVSGTMFVGAGSGVWRTKTHGLGSMSMEEAQQHCNTWTGDFAVTCGDWEQIGGSLGTVSAIERATSDSSSAWAATTAGRVYISKNVDAEPAGGVAWTRIDTLDADAPGRFVSSIYVDPNDPNHAWISYSGFDANTPATPGHVFEVTYDPTAGTATWDDRSFDLGDLPATDVAYDDVTGDLYASSDFGVMRLAAGTSSWTAAAPGMPNVETPGLVILPKERILYAATHGLSAWRLNLAK